MTGRWTLLRSCLIAIAGGTALVGSATEATAEESSPCLQRAAGDIFVPNVISGVNNKVAIPTNKTADFRNKSLVEDPPQYALGIRDAHSNACLTGLKVTGRGSLNWTWNFRKGAYDGDGVRVQLAGSPVTVERIWFYNVMDGFSPRSNSEKNRWHVRDAYMRYVRDDAIENDGCLGGMLEDSLIDGTFMGFSSRPGKSYPCPAGWKDNVFKVKDVYMRLECQPHDKPGHECGPGKRVGQIFKWRGSTPIAVEVRDSVFVQPALAGNGGTPMCYRPPGTYENVTIIWQGSGPWPCKEPAGITVTRDISIWQAAKADWLRRHGCTADGSYCRFTSK